MSRCYFLSFSLAYFGCFQVLSIQADVKNETSNSMILEPYQTQYFRVQEQEIRQFLETRGVLINQAIIASATNASSETILLIQGNLARNAMEIGRVFTSLFNPTIGSQIEALLNQAALINRELRNAIKANNLVLAEQLVGQAKVNGLQTAEFLGGLFFRIAFPTWKIACENYVLFASEQAIAYLQNNIALGENLRNLCIMQFQEIGDLIGQALDFQINPIST